MSIKIEIVGIKEAIDKLGKINQEKLDKADNAIKQAGFFIQEEVQESIAGRRAEQRSVDTGQFLNSVKTTFPQKFTAAIETNVEHAKFLEYGTSKMEPRAHFRNTKDRNINKVRDFVEKELK